MAKTSRVNISIPAGLHERLKRVKDKVNVSKVCVAALERELERLEARPTVSAAQLEQLIRRLQNNQERWAERGRQDGERWAVEVATRDELRQVGEVAAGEEGADTLLPRSFDLAAALEAWVYRDAGLSEAEIRDLGDGRRAPRYPPAVEAALRQARTQVDESAYRRGWTSAVRAIWKAVRPALQ